MEKYIYELKMKVRDYECDLQGIVNNANYQHYLEHTRHEFLTSVGISFARLHEEGVGPGSGEAHHGVTKLRCAAVTNSCPSSI